MPISEDFVKNTMASWLKSEGYRQVEARLGTRKGYDVEGVNSETGKLLVIECKGEAQKGSQLHRSWSNVASAILTSINEVSAPTVTVEVGMAFPDTKEYRGRMERLKQFCKSNFISVFWVAENGSIEKW
ncbi:MAG: hypothetical protein V4812_18075 [Pseudomonadota bacterium]